jgi:hypothetical protein
MALTIRTIDTEVALMEAVHELQDCNFIFGAMPSLEQIIEPEVTLELSFADGTEGDREIVAL